MMRFGIFSVVDHYPAELRRSAGEFYAELLEQVEAAEELGYDSFWIAEHHFHEYGAIPSPPVWMAAAAGRTRRIRLGVAVSVLPFRNPLLVAEEYAMVDVLSGGRLNFGAGSGYLKHEFEGFGVSPEEKRERFDEALAIIRKAWTGERFSHDGRFHRVRDVAIQVTPVQRPHPPIWVAILRNEAAPFVAKNGYPLMMIPYATTEQLDELARTVSAFKAAYREAGHGDPETLALAFGLHAYVAENFAEATAQAREAMDRYVRTRLYAKQRPYGALVEKSLIAYGSPEEVIRVFRRYEACGFTLALPILNFGGLPQKLVLRSMERLAREVLPAFASEGG